MVHKKKYHGGLLAFFFLLLVFLLGNCSSCFARTTLTDDEADYIWKYISSNSISNINNISYYNAYKDSSESLISRTNLDSHVGSFKTFFNSNNNLDFDYKNLILFSNFYSDSQWFYGIDIYYACFNNTFSSNFDYLYLQHDNLTNNISFRYYNPDDNTFSDLTLYKLKFILRKSDYYIEFRYITPVTFLDSQPLTLNYRFSSGFNNAYYQQNYIIENFPGIVSFVNTGVIYSNWNGYVTYSNPQSFFLKTLYSGGGNNPTPPIPDDTGDTGQITDSNGDITGTIDLTGIQNSLGNIDTTTQNIEQNTQTIIEQNTAIQQGLTTPPDMSETEIDSSDITDALDFNFPTDPYANFWLTLTTGLSDALTGNKRSIDITFRGTTYTISLDNFTLQVPAALKTILTLFSTTFVFWILIKWWKIILNKITSGNVDDLLAMNEEERHHRFILGGV